MRGDIIHIVGVVLLIVGIVFLLFWLTVRSWTWKAQDLAARQQFADIYSKADGWKATARCLHEACWKWFAETRHDDPKAAIRLVLPSCPDVSRENVLRMDVLVLPMGHDAAPGPMRLPAPTADNKGLLALYG